MQLLRSNAPGWTVEAIQSPDGGLVFRAPVGGYLLLRIVHEDGTCTPAVPQAIMNNRNEAIPYEKISARDITDTQRRGACLAVAYHFGLAAELWAKIQMESGWGTDEADANVAPLTPANTAPKAATAASQAAQATSGGTSEVTEDDFRKAALEKGIKPAAIDAIAKILNGKWAGGLKTLAGKNAEDLNRQYAPEEAEQW